MSLYGHCLQKLNRSHFVLIGGHDGKKLNPKSFFFDGIVSQWIEGPHLRISRKYHSCALLHFSTSILVVVAGGEARSGITAEVEFLNLEVPELGDLRTRQMHWIKGRKMKEILCLINLQISFWLRDFFPSFPPSLNNSRGVGGGTKDTPQKTFFFIGTFFGLFFTYLLVFRSFIASCFVCHLFGPNFASFESWQEKSDCCRWTWWRQLSHWNVPIILFHTYKLQLELEEIRARIGGAAMPFRNNESSFFPRYLSKLNTFPEVIKLVFFSGFYWTIEDMVNLWEKLFFVLGGTFVSCFVNGSENRFVSRTRFSTTMTIFAKSFIFHIHHLFVSTAMRFSHTNVTTTNPIKLWKGCVIIFIFCPYWIPLKNLGFVTFAWKSGRIEG